MTREHAEGFSKVWTRRGLAFILPDTAIDFATDFANLAIRDFIETCQRDAAERTKQQEARRIVPAS